VPSLFTHDVPPLFTNAATAVMFIGLAALAVAAVVASRRQQGQRDRSSDGLWHDLRRAHGLSRRETRLLREAAERASLNPASLVFMEPHVVMRLVDHERATRSEVQELMSKLYS